MQQYGCGTRDINEADLTLGQPCVRFALLCSTKLKGGVGLVGSRAWGWWAAGDSVLGVDQILIFSLGYQNMLITPVKMACEME